jgi:hypothetical protein
LLVGYLPKTHNQRLGPGQDERPAQAEVARAIAS